MLVFTLYSLLEIIRITHAAIAPPPWANPTLNPCALQPRGWQLLFWPPDGKCYKIFQVGYPCPEGMELSPKAIKSGEIQNFTAECRCPPKTAQYQPNGLCYQLFTNGPCPQGHYFAPDKIGANKRQSGVCKSAQVCTNPNEIYWPATNQCHVYLTRGPCPRGQLLTTNGDKVGVCKCNHLYEMRKFSIKDRGCFEHFTHDPCVEKGQLFLPDGTCGCHASLPHYHNDTQSCYEIGTIGPCKTNEQFHVDNDEKQAKCHCKNGYVRYVKDGGCYRPYTQGACASGQILLNETTCIPRPCQTGYLYFPKTKTCHRIGTQGPCTRGYVISFDLNARPSIDGVAYNAVCYCKEESECETRKSNVCEHKNSVVYQGQCYRLYTQGPCAKGAWLTMRRQEKRLDEENDRQGVCECMPRYKETIREVSGQNFTECTPPTVILANFLNKTKRIVSN